MDAVHLINRLEICEQNIKRGKAAIQHFMDTMEKQVKEASDLVEQISKLRDLPAQQERDFNKIVNMLQNQLPAPEPKKEDAEDEEDAHERLMERMRQARLANP